MTSTTLPLPIIDLSASTRTATAKHLTSSCRETGFVYITNHGIAAELVDEAFQWSQRLFALEMEEKMQAPHPDGAKVHRGYSWPGLEKVSQYMSADGDGDERKVGELRKVTDCKVCLLPLTYLDTTH